MEATELLDRYAHGERDFCGALLRGADLSEANLTAARFRDADFSGACLCGADLSRADLSGALLGGANLTGALLRERCCAGLGWKARSSAGSI